MEVIQELTEPLIGIIESYTIFKPISRSELIEAIDLWFENMVLLVLGIQA